MGGGKAIVFCSDSFRHSLSQYIYFSDSSNPIADCRGEKTRRLCTPQGMKFCHFYYKCRSFKKIYFTRFYCLNNRLNFAHF